MTQLGDFWCKNRKPDSLDCERNLECPRAWGGECDFFNPDGNEILYDIIENWFRSACQGDGLTHEMAERLHVAILQAAKE